MSENLNVKTGNKKSRVSLPVLFIMLVILSAVTAITLSAPLSVFYRNAETVHRIAESRMLESSLFMNIRMNDEVSEDRERNLKSMMQFLIYVQEKNPLYQHWMEE